MKIKKIIRRSLGLVYRLISPVFDPIKAFCAFPNYVGYLVDFVKYFGSKNSEKIKIMDLYPIVNEKTATTYFDPQYFYQGVWAFEKIYNSKVRDHVDVGSQTNLVSFLTIITRVKFVDIRPLQARLNNFESVKGSILDLPFSDNSINSLSCLHVAEHIGLGRYGDSIDPLGTKKACRELVRVLAPGGGLYFSLPIGVPTVCFNAHRVHSVQQILNYFDGLKLEEFSAVDDKGNFIKNADADGFKEAIYSGGLFHFIK